MFKFDGHFWVERDGQIIDPWFNEYDFVISVHGCLKERRYLKCPNDLVGRVLLRMFERSEFYSLLMANTPYFNNCIANSLKEIEQNGGTLVFGSLGFARKDGSVHWEFGGESWCTVKDFLKK